MMIMVLFIMILIVSMIVRSVRRLMVKLNVSIRIRVLISDIGIVMIGISIEWSDFMKRKIIIMMMSRVLISVVRIFFNVLLM